MKAFADQNIDALVLPALGIVAPPHNMVCYHYHVHVSYVV